MVTGRYRIFAGEAAMQTLITHIKTLWQTGSTDGKPVAGKNMAELPHVDNAFLLIENGIIADFGSMEHCPGRSDTIINASGKMVLPAWCDSHTHLVFAANREDEFAMRIKGKTYTEIAAAGGGILNSVKKLRSMPEAELFDGAWQRLEEVKRKGTGAIEIKSGYGLSPESELKMLRVIRQLKEKHPLLIRSTFLGAHAFPEEYKNDHEGYIRCITDKMLPEIAGEGLADYCDVFCEEGYFSNAETDRILEAAAKYGLKPKIHVNQFSNSGGVQTGVRNHAVSVDHLECMGDAEIETLRNSNTLPVALPACSFFIGIPYTPGRKIIDAGLPLVLASDMNPGSSPTGNMQFIIALACIQMQLTPEEAINAATINGAAAMEISGITGSIAKGKKANIIITKKLNSLAEIPYNFAGDSVDEVIIPK